LLKEFMLSDQGRNAFLGHAYAVGQIKQDKEGFLTAGDASTDRLMEWLASAAAIVKDPSRKATTEEVGPLLGEVIRQQRTIHAGN
jgi:hypothetical protein